MKLEHKFLITAVLAVILAVPVAQAIQHRTHLLKLERAENSTLHIQLKATQNDLQLKNTQIEQQKQQLKDKDKQLQAKRDSKATIAVAPAQTAPVISSIGSAGNCESYRGLVAQYNWNVDIALAVMHAESGCSPTASSPTCDHGLMQINCVHADMVGGDLASLNDPATNVRVAYRVYSGAGWNAWTTYTSGAYLKFI